MRAQILVAAAVALAGCSRSDFLNQVERVQNGAQNGYLAQQEARRSDAWRIQATDPNAPVISRRVEPEKPPEPEKPASDPAKPAPQTYIYIPPS